MKITVSPQAHQWYKDELNLSSGDGLRFKPKGYGKTNVHDGISLAIQVERPENNDKIFASEEIDGILYHALKEDDWFFADYDFEANFNEKIGEPDYKFIER